nr:MAG TPA: hypothetical protein [Caudoviricetes sp.]
MTEIKQYSKMEIIKEKSVGISTGTDTEEVFSI